MQPVSGSDRTDLLVEVLREVICVAKAPLSRGDVVSCVGPPHLLMMPALILSQQEYAVSE